jgi:hypothetical protein
VKRDTAGLFLLALALLAWTAPQAGCRRSVTRRLLEKKQKYEDAAGEDVMSRLGRPATRAAAARQIGQSKLREAIPALQGYLQDPDPQVRINCLWALGEMAARQAVPDVRTLLTDYDQCVRAAAAEALGKMPDKAAILWLGQTLSDQVWQVRLEAAKALGNIADEQAAQRLMQAMDDIKPQIAAAAAEGLRRIGQPAIGPIRAGLVRLSPQRRLLVTRSLAGMKGPAAAEALVEVLALSVPSNGRGRQGQPQAEACGVAVEALVAIGEPAIEPLARAAVYVNGQLPLKTEAAKVLARLGRPAVKPIAERITPWKVFPNRQELDLWVETLGRIDDPAAAEAIKEARKRYFGAEPGPDEKLPGPSGAPKAPTTMGASTRRAALDEGSLPTDGLVRLVLRGALIRTDKPPAQEAARDLNVDLQRHRGRWLPDVTGKGVAYNQGDHVGEVLKHQEAGGRHRLTVEMLILDDHWVKGGLGVYEVELGDAAGKLAGSYRGWFNGRDVRGEVSATVQHWPEAAFGEINLASGEHPRLLFRRRDLPAMRQKARSPFGRAVVAALQSKATTESQGIDQAIGWALLHVLFGDAQYGRQAVPLIRHYIAHPPGGHIHDSARRIQPLAIAYDLACNCMTPGERPKDLPPGKQTVRVTGEQIAFKQLEDSQVLRRAWRQRLRRRREGLLWVVRSLPASYHARQAQELLGRLREEGAKP